MSEAPSHPEEPTPEAPEAAAGSDAAGSDEDALYEESYHVHLPIFEGPFDLLLHLVKINEMEVTDISLALLTRQYLDHIEAMKRMNLDVAGDFLVVAATLLQIKARALLPSEADDAEEDLDDDEIDETLSARELMRQLIEYRSYKEIVATLKELEHDSEGVFYRHRAPEFIDPEAGAEPAIQGDLQALFSAMSNVLRFIEKRDPHTDLFEKYTVEDKIDYLRARLGEARRVSAVEEFERCLNKVEVIVTFLAILELVRLRRVGVEVDESGEKVEIFMRETDGDDAETASDEAAAPDETNGQETQTQE